MKIYLRENAASYLLFEREQNDQRRMQLQQGLPQAHQITLQPKTSLSKAFMQMYSVKFSCTKLSLLLPLPLSQPEFFYGTIPLHRG